MVANTPDWRAIVAACGADPDIVRYGDEHGASFGVGNVVIGMARVNDRWSCALVLHDDPASAVRTAIVYMRGAVDRRIAELQAARVRLGPSAPAPSHYPEGAEDVAPSIRWQRLANAKTGEP